jgi:hypothetical protein
VITAITDTGATDDEVDMDAICILRNVFARRCLVLVLVLAAGPSCQTDSSRLSRMLTVFDSHKSKWLECAQHSSEAISALESKQSVSTKLLESFKQEKEWLKQGEPPVGDFIGNTKFWTNMKNALSEQRKLQGEIEEWDRRIAQSRQRASDCAISWRKGVATDLASRRLDRNGLIDKAWLEWTTKNPNALAPSFRR